MTTKLPKTAMELVNDIKVMNVSPETISYLVVNLVHRITALEEKVAALESEKKR